MPQNKSQAIIKTVMKYFDNMIRRLNNALLMCSSQKIGRNKYLFFVQCKSLKKSFQKCKNVYYLENTETHSFDFRFYMRPISDAVQKSHIYEYNNVC